LVKYLQQTFWLSLAKSLNVVGLARNSNKAGKKPFFIAYFNTHFLLLPKDIILELQGNNQVFKLLIKVSRSMQKFISLSSAYS